MPQFYPLSGSLVGLTFDQKYQIKKKVTFLFLSKKLLPLQFFLKEKALPTAGFNENIKLWKLKKKKLRES